MQSCFQAWLPPVNHWWISQRKVAQAMNTEVLQMEQQTRLSFFHLWYLLFSLTASFLPFSLNFTCFHLFVGKLAYCMLNRWRHDQPHSSRYKVMHMYIKTPQNLVQIRSYFEKRAKWFLHGSEVARHPSTNSFSQPASQWPAEQAENKLRARAQNATRERGAHVRVEKNPVYSQIWLFCRRCSQLHGLGLVGPGSTPRPYTVSYM